jgi:GNAT superfamily N-acetyltransferase
LDGTPRDVVGYYTLATGGVTRSEMPRKIRHDLPNPVPVMILGRLAVDERHQKKGIGPAMLTEAMQRILEISQSAGVRALLVHAIDDEAVAFYLKYGFVLFPRDGRTMFLPIETLAAAL